MIKLISDLTIPLIVLLILIYGVVKKVNVYDEFVDGAKESFSLSLTLFPCLLAMVLGINLFVNSGFLNKFLSIFNNVFAFIKVPSDIIPLALLRPISGSSALALLNDLFESHGPDSLIGRLGSVIQGSTETTFYVLTIYFGSIGVKKIRYALWVGLVSDLIGIISSIILVKCLF